VVGLVIGALIAGAYVGLSLALPALLAAVLAVSAGSLVTGALHEDGLADIADAFAGAWTIERRLEILDDPRLGTFGVLALIGAFAARVVAISSLGGMEAVALLPCAHALSRVPGVMLMRRARLARRESLAATFARELTVTHELAAAGVGVILAALLVGWWALPFMLMSFSISVAMWALAHRKIGGISGDVLGATQQLVELGTIILGVAVVYQGWGELAWRTR
jgi:adenosylcobinamide-GDP ribazoletransferase